MIFTVLFVRAVLVSVRSVRIELVAKVFSPSNIVIRSRRRRPTQVRVYIRINLVGTDKLSVVGLSGEVGRWLVLILLLIGVHHRRPAAMWVVRSSLRVDTIRRRRHVWVARILPCTIPSSITVCNIVAPQTSRAILVEGVLSSKRKGTSRSDYRSRGCAVNIVALRVGIRGLFVGRERCNFIIEFRPRRLGDVRSSSAFSLHSTSASCPSLRGIRCTYSHPMIAPAMTTPTKAATTIPATAPVDKLDSDQLPACHRKEY